MINRLFFTPFLAIIFAAGLALTTSSAYAQYDYYSSPSFYYNTVTVPNVLSTQSIQRNAEERYARENQGRSTKGGKAGRSSTTKKPQASASTPKKKPVNYAGAYANELFPYKRDTALAEKMKQAFLTDFAKQMPEGAAMIRQQANEIDLVMAAAFVMKKNGLDSNTMEGITSYWLGAAWAVANQRPLPTATQYQAIADQIRENGQGNAAWAKLSNMQRQTYYEGIAYPIVTETLRYQVYLDRRDRNMMSNMAQNTQDGMKKIGLDLQNMNLGANGFSVK